MLPINIYNIYLCDEGHVERHKVQNYDCPLRDIIENNWFDYKYLGTAIKYDGRNWIKKNLSKEVEDLSNGFDVGEVV